MGAYRERDKAYVNIALIAVNVLPFLALPLIITIFIGDT